MKGRVKRPFIVLIGGNDEFAVFNGKHLLADVPTTSTIGDDTCPHGSEFVAPLGLYYYKARMYSPALGRFLQTDPVGYKDDLNLYAYVGNNPINFSDPTGLTACADKAAAEQQQLRAAQEKERAAIGQSSAAAMAAAGKIGVPANALAAGAAGAMSGVQSATAKSFFEGTQYSPKVLAQASSGDYHAFPQSVGAFSGEGTVKSIVGGDGVTRSQLTIPGEYNGKTGVFEYIRDAAGAINHRLFVPN